MAFDKTETTFKCPMTGKAVELYTQSDAEKGLGKMCFLRSPGLWVTGLFPSKTAALDWGRGHNGEGGKDAFLSGADAKGVTLFAAGHKSREFRVSGPGWVSDKTWPDPNRALAAFGLAPPPTKVERIDRVEPHEEDDDAVRDYKDDDLGGADEDELLDIAKTISKKKGR